MKGEGHSLFESTRIGLNIWWQKPRLRTDEDEEKERRATWLELFYDLIYVAVISQLSHKLAGDMSLKGVLGYMFLFVPVWLVWLSSTYYNERFEVYDVRHRAFTFLKMIPVAGLAYSVHGALGETSTIFALSYILARIILIYMWLSAGERQDLLTKRMARRFTLGSSVSILFWIVSLLFHGEMRFALWGIGLLIELITPAATMGIQSEMTKLSFSHISERFGLFTILTIAETVIGVVNGIAKTHHLTLYNGSAGVLGLILAFAIWWIYFDHVIYRPFRYSTWTIFAWSALHLPITIGITAVGTSVVSIISHEGQAMETSLRLVLCGSVGFILLLMGIIGMLNEKHDHQRSIKFNDDLDLQMLLCKIAGTLIIVVFAFFGNPLGPVLLLSILVLVMSGVAVQGLYFWVKAQMPKEI